MKRALGLWWAFFWRYVIIFVILLFLLGFFAGVQDGMYLEVITSAHVIIDAITKSDLITIRVINLVSHVVASFLSILWIVKSKKL